MERVTEIVKKILDDEVQGYPVETTSGEIIMMVKVINEQSKIIRLLTSKISDIDGQFDTIYHQTKECVVTRFGKFQNHLKMLNSYRRKF